MHLCGYFLEESSVSFLNQQYQQDTQISISIYFVAKSDQNKHAVRVMDGTSFDVIAPSSLITDFKNGVWWTLRYSKSVRLRLMNVKGIHLSAIAFATTTTTTPGRNGG